MPRQQYRLSHVGPTSVLSYRRWANVNPIFIAVCMTIKTTIFTHRPRASLARLTFCWWRHNQNLMTSQWLDSWTIVTRAREKMIRLCKKLRQNWRGYNETWRTSTSTSTHVLSNGGVDVVNSLVPVRGISNSLCMFYKFVLQNSSWGSHVNTTELH